MVFARTWPLGIAVDYLGLADQLKYALSVYTESGGQGDPTYDTAQAIAAMMEKWEIAASMLHGLDWSKWTTGTGVERLKLIAVGQQRILEQQDGKRRFVSVVTDLSRAFALCAASDEATGLRDDISYFQAIAAVLSKQSSNGKRSPEQIESAASPFWIFDFGFWIAERRNCSRNC